MSPREHEQVVDPYELVEEHWPYDGPYSDEHTIAGALMIARLGRYLNNATQKRDGLPSIAVVGRLLGELHGAVVGHEQLFGQLARYCEREAGSNPSVYDDRYDRLGTDTAREVAAELRTATARLRVLDAALQKATVHAYHLGSD